MVSITPDLLAEAWRLHKLGVETMNVGRLTEATEALREGLRLVGWRADRSFVGPEDVRTAVARLLISLAYAESEQGRHQYGLSLLDLAESLTPESLRGTLMQQRGVVTHKAGRLSEALDQFNAAQYLVERHGTPFQIVSLFLNRGVVNGELGRIAAARSDLRQSAALAEENELSVLTAKALHAHGNVEVYADHIPAALKIYDQTLRLYDTHAPDLAPQILLNKTHALLRVGLLREAAVLCDSLIQDYQRSGQTWWGLAVAALHRAHIALEIESTESALLAAQRAEERAREIGSAFSIQYAGRLRREAEFRAGQLDDRYVPDVLALADRLVELGDPLDAAVAQMLAARAMIRHGALADAEEVLRRSNRGVGYDGPSIRILRRLAWAELHVAHDDRSAALAQLRSGLNQLHGHRSRLGSVELQAGMASLGRKLAEKGVELVVDSGKAHTIFSWSERSKAQAFRLAPVSPPKDSEISELITRVRRARNELRERELFGEPADELRAQCRAWEKQLQEHSWQSPGTGESVPLVRPRQIHDELGDRALVSYFVDRGRLHALSLADGVTRHIRLGSVGEVAEAARRIAADLAAAAGRRLPERMLEVVRRSIRHQADQLGASLLGPLANDIGDRELVIVPTQATASLPWGLLPPLVERPVTVTPSASVWWSSARRPVPDHSRVLLASGPDLAHAEAELEALAGHHPGGRVLRDKDAIPETILAGLDGASLGHLAAHGYHEPDNVMFSRLDFADGPLMAYDIAQLSRPPVHVTLSACDVGRSTVSIGDETLGFTAALLHSGTRTVISSVTKVEHRAAVDVMTAYHAALVRGVAPARALADASQRQPFASFVCYGAG